MKRFSLVSCFASLVFATLAASEADLEAKLPEIFAKSAAHYKALDAAATPLMKVKGKSEEGKSAEGTVTIEYCVPHGFNRKSCELDMRSIYWWTAGHFPGSLWYLYEATGDDFFRDRATVWTENLAPNAKVTDNHDIGFIMYCSYGNARRLLKTDKYDALLVETANSLCQRYNAKLGLIRSWGAKDEKKDFLVIPDNLMNLELLEFAAWKGKVEKVGGCGQWNFDQIAMSHADVTMKHHFRDEGSCYHVLDYDQEVGRVKGIMRGQGASCETAWARGQSWAIYGYTMMYRATGYIRYLDFAKKLADWAIGHPNMPADGVPYWDYGAPGEERDTSAAAVMASALLELSQYVGTVDRERYRGFAVKQLLSLASDAYFSEGNEIGHFLLRHGVGSKPSKSEIDTPLDYGDYYFLEALIRFKNLMEREKSVRGAPGIGALPAKATLPKEELSRRTAVKAADALARAERVLTEPIPPTPDDLYGEYWTTGNRTRYQNLYFSRCGNLDALAIAEAKENKGRYLARLEDYLAAICDMKSWVLPAHDWPDGGKGTLRGTWISTDLCSTEMAARLACVVRMLDGKLRPATVARVKAEAERRVFGPIRRELPFRIFSDTNIGGVARQCLWWIDCGNNWNSVCWDNVVCAALGLIDDPADRAYFVAAADIAADRYIADGFSADGYCSEGMGYWNYGFGHHLMTGRLLSRVTDGKFDFFRTAARSSSAPYQRGRKEALAAAYARAYTLMDGASPAFADGTGAASPVFLGIVDEFWPDLPKTLPPASEFPVGQVWLFRDSKGLSVAFKGGHNNELHNHNDIGSYYIVADGQFVAGDPGGEEYTRRTFGPHRYESKVLNSYGHPVPVVGGKLQGTGSKFAAKVLEKKVEKVGGGGQRNVVVLDLTGAYDVKTLKKLTRTFVYDRAVKTFTVRDHAEFSEQTAFEDCTVTFGALPNVHVKGKGQSQGKTEVALIGKPVEKIENPNRKTPHRFAWAFEKPVMSADVEFVFAHEKRSVMKRNLTVDLATESVRGRETWMLSLSDEWLAKPRHARRD